MTPTDAELLRSGELEIMGRLTTASNATLRCVAQAGGVRRDCVYKPRAGERPLWDFPRSSLGHREVAAYLVSEALGWGVVPTTVWRETGPFGAGMCQTWIHPPAGTDEPALDLDPVDVVRIDAVPPGWRTILEAQDAEGEPVLLVHADVPRLQQIALFDVIANNADRKGGHVLRGEGGELYGIDHGLTFHEQPKLRTVLWGWIGEDLREQDAADLARFIDDLDSGRAQELEEHLTARELAALRTRVTDVLAQGCYPAPGGEWPALPWPAF